MSRARDVSNVISSGAGGSGPQGSGTQPYSTIASLPLTGNETGEQAFVSENNRLYIWNGTGWYNIALVNTSPTAITGASGSYAFATDGTPIEITLVSTDPEGLPITWSYAVTSGSLENGGGATATISQAANVFTITPTTNEDYAGEFILTFTASDGVNLATATSSFTLVFMTIVTDSKYTSLMLKTTGTNAQQNNTFVDSSTNNFAITRNGNPTQGTFSPYGDKWSNYFDGSGDYLTVQDSTPTAGDATVEFWIYPVTQVYGGDAFIIGTLNNAQGTWAISIRNSPRVLSLWVDSYSGAQFNSNTNFDFNVWNHIALVKQSGILYLYVNGVKQTGSYSQASSFGQGSSVVIGAYSANGGQNYTGYISNVRIVYGTSLYTSNFTPPTDPLTAIAGTRLLTCQSNSFKDNSTNNFVINKTGDVKVQRFSPYDIEPYDPAVIGGSAYFDGNGDYLTAPSSSAFALSGDFTVEAWVYLTSVPGAAAGYIIDFRNGSTNNFTFGVYQSVQYGWVSGNGFSGSVGLLPNTWYHMAWVRSGGTITSYLNGVSNSTIALSYSQGSTSCTIGARYTQAAEFFPGYIADLRVCNGTALYTGNFTPPTAPLTAIANTSLLLKCTDAGIYDSSGNNDIETRGNAQVSTAVTKYGSSSMYFDGTGDCLTTPATTNLSFGTGDFTVECWVLFNSISDSGGFVGSSVGGYDFCWLKTAGLTIGRINTAYDNSFSWTPTVSQWYHIAYSRSGTSLKVFVNGTQVGTATNSIAYNAVTNCVIGGSTTGDRLWNGYISDLRITKGLARYTENFTPPTSELLG